MESCDDSIPGENKGNDLCSTIVRRTHFVGEDIILTSLFILNNLQLVLICNADFYKNNFFFLFVMHYYVRSICRLFS